ncbi:MAG: hypothetical protein HRU49_14420 [Winogradskyella sp.]|uniref:hypothetical protein n=1 Tax=Winogradskyella sp. TaxID=1883156 RepID=UPI0025DA0C5E|nr:hypothetical protein [Winogradskyella sp.]NRB84943.1 hypothetical protein [Winogradskyella sp.]
MLLKRKKAKKGYDELLSFKLLVNRKFKTLSYSINKKEYTISDYFEDTDQFEIEWYCETRGGISDRLYDRKDVVEYIKDGSWILLKN